MSKRVNNPLPTRAHTVHTNSFNDWLEEEFALLIADEHRNNVHHLAEEDMNMGDECYIDPERYWRMV